jgi:GWxTD domain-containing protein
MNVKVETLFLLSLAMGARGDERLDRLPANYREWLEEEVVYIITEAEREVFLSLGTLVERERFIEAFWEARDPNRATPENEFRTEHYRRLSYANQKLSRETARPGWKTDRGRMYVILGEPQQITRFEAHSEIVQCELWLYPSEPEKGLPSSFNLLFFRRKGFGEYELYNPILHGPNALLVGYQYTPASDTDASLLLLQRISPELARATLSLDLGEPADFATRRPALGTDLLLERIESSAKRSVETDYADAYLRYGGRVSADYSFRFVPHQGSFAVMYGPEETPFVHYSVELEPEDFALMSSEDGSKLYTTLDVTREVRSSDGTLVELDDQERYLEIGRSQFQQGARLPFAYQDAFPLVPGDYQVSIVLRNRAVRQYTVAERQIHVPGTDEKGPALADVVLGYLHETSLSEEHPGFVQAFQVGHDRIYPAAEGVFPIGAELVVFAQTRGDAAGFRLRVSVLDGETVLEQKETKLEAGSERAQIFSFSLLGMAGGRYAVRAELLDGAGAVVSERRGNWIVSPRNTIPRPGFIYRRGFPAETPGLLALKRGEQFWNLGRIDDATRELTRAVDARNPDLPEAVWKLAAVLLSTGQSEKALTFLAPMETRFPNQYEVIGGLGFAYYFRRDFAKARDFLERASTLRPPDKPLLNALGDCYRETGDAAKAAETYRLSLQIDPDQEDVKKLLWIIAPPGTR